jgi:hypothetical protein
MGSVRYEVRAYDGRGGRTVPSCQKGFNQILNRKCLLGHFFNASALNLAHFFIFYPIKSPLIK